MGEQKEFVAIIARVPRSIRQAIRQEAFDEERSMNQVINSALKAYFNAPKGQGPRKRKG